MLCQILNGFVAIRMKFINLSGQHIIHSVGLKLYEATEQKPARKSVPVNPPSSTGNRMLLRAEVTNLTLLSLTGELIH